MKWRNGKTAYLVLAAALAVTIAVTSQLSSPLRSRAGSLHALPEDTSTPAEVIPEPMPITADQIDGGTGSVKQSASGPVSDLPWDGDGKFAQAQQSNNAKVLMAAYRTVLKDPLPGEEYNVHLAASLLCGTVVKPGEIFSQNQKIGPYTKARGFKEGPTYSGANLIKTTGGGVCKIASTLYNVAVLSNLPVVERRNHSMPVPYVPYGQDATVAVGVIDLKFRNNQPFPILIWAQGIDNTLYIAFYGEQQPPKVDWHHETLSEVKAPTVTRRNRALPAGAKKLVIEGMNGKAVRSWVTIAQPDGTTIIKKMGVSYYRPFPNVVEVGS